MFRNSRVALALALTVLICAAAQAQVKTVSITPAKAEGEVGQQIKLSVAGLDADGKPIEQKAQLWAAIPGDVAVASEDGTIALFAPGEATIIAVVGGKLGRATIRVKPARVAKVVIDKLGSALVVGGSLKLNATAIGANDDPRAEVVLNWSSANASVATVDAAGLVTGVAPGKTKLLAQAEGATGELAVEVVKSNVRSLTALPRSSNARTGDVIRFTAQAKDGGGGEVKNAAVRWMVSGEGAQIDNDGGFVAAKPGTYVVTATIGEQSSSASVIVAPRQAERALVQAGRVRLKDIQVTEQWMFGNYLYVATIGDQVQIYDISDPANPKLTDTLKVDAHVINDVSLTPDGKLGVLTREGASNRKNGIVFFDATDVAHPKILSEYTTTVTGGVHSAFPGDVRILLDSPN
mgnify:CR=1 FL=1